MQSSHTHHIALVTANFERIRDFYTNVLGFSLVGQFPGRNIIFVEIGSTAIEIVENTNRATASAAGGWVHIAFEVEDCDAAFAELSAAGISFHVQPQFFPEDAPLARIAFFRDPDGNELELFQPLHGRYPR